MNHSKYSFPRLIVITILTLSGIATCLPAEQPSPSPESPPDSTPQVLPDTGSSPDDYIKVVSLYLNDGSLVTGRVLSETANKITIEQIENSRFVVNTFGLREFKTRTIAFEKMPLYQYYRQTADNFASRTGDFQNDPDEFILAIRFYEKARHALQNSHLSDPNKITQIEQALQATQADREIWIREAESRTALQKLEFQLRFEDYIKQLQNQDKQISRRLEEFYTDLQNFRKSIETIDKNWDWQLDRLRDDIRDNRAEIEDLWDSKSGAVYIPSYPRYYYPYYYRSGRKKP